MSEFTRASSLRTLMEMLRMSAGMKGHTSVTDADIVHATGMSRRWVQMAVRELEASGRIGRLRHRGARRIVVIERAAPAKGGDS